MITVAITIVVGLITFYFGYAILTPIHPSERRYRAELKKRQRYHHD